MSEKTSLQKNSKKILTALFYAVALLIQEILKFRDVKPTGIASLQLTTSLLLQRAFSDSNFKDKNFVSAKGKRVVVIGGGDTGNDCVGTAIRLGAKSVTQLEMMPKAPDERTEMNPWPRIGTYYCKTDYGQEEAIAVFGHDPRIYQTTVTEFIKDDKGNVQKAKLVKLEPKKDEKTGRMNMVPVEGSETIIED